jgi:hypothetical protein
MSKRPHEPHVSGPEANFPGNDYSDEERAFLVAMERYKRLRRRPFPTCREVLYVLRSLGYRKLPPAKEPNLKTQEPKIDSDD